LKIKGFKAKFIPDIDLVVVSAKELEKIAEQMKGFNITDESGKVIGIILDAKVVKETIEFEGKIE
jgi:uncharacterized ferredoxin-like protein